MEAPPIVPGSIRDYLRLSDGQIACNLGKSLAHASNGASREMHEKLLSTIWRKLDQLLKAEQFQSNVS